MKGEIDKKIVKDEEGNWKDSEYKELEDGKKEWSKMATSLIKGVEKSELKLEELSNAINSDFEWAMNTSLIFENHGVEDPETIGFLKGVAYCTEMYLDILEREGVIKHE